MFWTCIIFVTLIALIILISRRLAPKTVSLGQKHVVVTGGSSGIGKAIAILAAKQGANVTILARNKLRLEEAKTEIQQHLHQSRKVQSISVDLSGSYEDVQKAIREAEEKFGPVFMLVNSAGMSVSRSFQDLDATDFKKQMEANYLSAVYTTKAVIDTMVQQQAGRVVFLSSQAGQIGLFGFSAYSASKFALRGLAESLQMEMTPHNVRVTVAFPPDTDTPGFQQEQHGKPKETLLISETAGLLNPQYVAQTILGDSLRGQFISYQGLDGWMLANISAGMSPATSFFKVIEQFFLMGLLRVVGLVYLASFDSIVLRCKKEREEEKQKQS